MLCHPAQVTSPSGLLTRPFRRLSHTPTKINSTFAEVVSCKKVLAPLFLKRTQLSASTSLMLRAPWATAAVKMPDWRAAVLPAAGQFHQNWLSMYVERARILLRAEEKPLPPFRADNNNSDNSEQINQVLSTGKDKPWERCRVPSKGQFLNPWNQKGIKRKIYYF